MKRFATVVLSGALAASFSQLAPAQAYQPETQRESAWQSCADENGVRCLNERAGPRLRGGNPESIATNPRGQAGAGGTAGQNPPSRETGNPGASAWQSCGDDDNVRCLNERADRAGEL